jgi:uncharacterized membrane protein (UPF0127 family)
MCGNRLSRRQYLTAAAVGTVTVTGCVGGGSEDGDGERFADYETTDVTVESSAGEQLGSVTAAIADTRDLRYTGLSDTDSLPEEWGMLFVYEEEQPGLTFVMREMDFPIDIVYAGADGVITSIHNARAPGPDEDGENLRYPGSGQYVLEVVADWTTERGVEPGDRLVFELP